jgi:hypothetical protein
MEEIAEEEGDPEKKAAKKLQKELEKRESGMEPSRVAVVVTSSAAPLSSGARAQARSHLFGLPLAAGRVPLP